jgi:hypothetical protein
MSSCTFATASIADPPKYPREVEVHATMIVSSYAIYIHTEEVVVEIRMRRSALSETE